MNFYKRLNGWAWIEILLLITVIVIDNLRGNPEDLWFPLFVVLSFSVPIIFDEVKYYYSLPVNHPDQKISDKDILSNFIRSWLSLFVCLAPILYAPIWVKVLAVISAVIAAYAVVVSHRLYSFTKNDVKYEG